MWSLYEVVVRIYLLYFLFLNFNSIFSHRFKHKIFSFLDKVTAAIKDCPPLPPCLPAVRSRSWPSLLPSAHTPYCLESLNKKFLGGKKDPHAEKSIRGCIPKNSHSILPVSNPNDRTSYFPLQLMLTLYDWTSNSENIFWYTEPIIQWSAPYLDTLCYLNTLGFLNTLAYLGHLVSQCRKTQISCNGQP